MSGGEIYNNFSKYTHKVGDVCLSLKKKVRTEHRLIDEARALVQLNLKSWKTKYNIHDDMDLYSRAELNDNPLYYDHIRTSKGFLHLRLCLPLSHFVVQILNYFQ